MVSSAPELNEALSCVSAVAMFGNSGSNGGFRSQTDIANHFAIDARRYRKLSGQAEVL
jgi:hypothetical protein